MSTTPSTLIVPCSACGTANRIASSRLGDQPDCGRCGKPVFATKPIALSGSDSGADPGGRSGASFDRQIRGDVPIVIDFWAAWCGPCRSMAPAFDQAAQRFAPRLRFGKVDVDAEQAIANRFGIRSIPTLAVFRDGREIERRSGALDAGSLGAWIERFASTSGAAPP